MIEYGIINQSRKQEMSCFGFKKHFEHLLRNVDIKCRLTMDAGINIINITRLVRLAETNRLRKLFLFMLLMLSRAIDIKRFGSILTMNKRPK